MPKRCEPGVKRAQETEWKSPWVGLLCDAVIVSLLVNRMFVRRLHDSIYISPLVFLYFSSFSFLMEICVGLNNFTYSFLQWMCALRRTLVRERARARTHARERPNDAKFYPFVWPFSIVCTFSSHIVVATVCCCCCCCCCSCYYVFGASFSSSKCVICLFDACLFSTDLNKFAYCSFSQHLFTPEGSRNRTINIEEKKHDEKKRTTSVSSWITWYWQKLWKKRRKETENGN